MVSIPTAYRENRDERPALHFKEIITRSLFGSVVFTFGFGLCVQDAVEFKLFELYSRRRICIRL